jgi:N-methylhydantoinase A
MRVTTDYYIEKNDRNAGYPIKSPVVDIVEIGNGGGSVAWIDELGSLNVGPQSAGANPGPVSYGLGGTQPTTTDANLLVGRLSDKNFDYAVDMEGVRAAIKETVADPFHATIEEAALGIIDIANSNMLNALKLISVRKGYDPKDFTMVAFGGGGPMHAAELARSLGIRKVVIPFTASVFSTWGMLMSDIRHDDIQTYLKKFREIDFKEINGHWKSMEETSIQQYREEDFNPDRVVFSKFVDLRYEGQEHTVKVPISNETWDEDFIQRLKSNFHELHEQSYTFQLPDAEVEVVNLHLMSLGKIDKPEVKKIERNHLDLEETVIEQRKVFFREKGWLTVPVYNRSKLDDTHVITGPSIIEEETASTLILDNQRAEIDSFGNIIIEVEQR